MQKHLFALCLACCLLCSAAQADPLGDIIGISKKYRSIRKFFSGTTEVTPAYSLFSWKRIEFGHYHNFYICDKWFVSRDLHTGRFSYIHKFIRLDGRWHTTIEAFTVPDVQRLNYSCDLSFVYDDGSVDLTQLNCLREFEIVVWANKVVKTGSFAKGEPYTAWLKSKATRLSNNCGTPPADTRDVRAKVKIFDTGHTIVKMGLVDYDYSWPMLCWVGDPGDY